MYRQPVWPPGFTYPSDPYEPPCWLGCRPVPPGILGNDAGQSIAPWPFGAPPPVDISVGQQPQQQESLLRTIVVASLPAILAGVAVYYLTRERKPEEKQLPNPVSGKAQFTGWTCVSGPAEFVDYLVDHATSVSYREFAKHVEVKTLGFWNPSKDWAITWLRTRMPSGKEAWVAQHSGIEHLCVNGYYDHDAEVRLARVWAAQQAG